MATLMTVKEPCQFCERVLGPRSTLEGEDGNSVQQGCSLTERPSWAESTSVKYDTSTLPWILEKNNSFKGFSLLLV